MFIGLYRANYATLNTVGDLRPVAESSNILDAIQEHDEGSDIDINMFAATYIDFPTDGYVDPKDVEGTGRDADERDMSLAHDSDGDVQMVSAE
jgi:hypothetical protein